MMGEVEGIILAAGLSTRLLGKDKIWIDICGDPMICLVVRESLASKLDRVIVVLGPSSAARMVEEDAVFSNPRLSVVMNYRPEAGMSWSIRSGLGHVDQYASGAAFILGDQPFITAGVINRLIDTFTNNQGKIVAPLIQGRRSTPVVFPAALFPEVMKITGDVGARSIVNRHAENVIGLEMGTLYDDTDLDTPDDLVEIRKKMFERKSGL
jgi:molybdenum cofactor cytidylyltransferase